VTNFINPPEQHAPSDFDEVNTTTLAGTATLSALVVILDYALKYSNLKIPYPLLPHLKLDFTGIPIVISALLF